MRILANNYDGLVGYDGQGVLQKMLAESYQVSKSGKRYEFKLRPGATWSDGVPVRANDFVTGIRRSLSPESSGKLAEFLFPIQGARNFHSGKTKELPSVREERGNLVIDLEEPTPHFIGVLALSISFPQRQDVLEKIGGKWPTGSAIGSLPVTGPYRMVSHEADKSIWLEANPNYWGGAPSISKVEVVVVKDETTSVHLFEQGRLDILSRVPTIDYERLKKQGVIHTDPFHATYFLAFNCRKEPFNDRDWRRAVAASINRKEIADLLATGEAPARSWVPRGIEGALPFKPEEIRYSDSVQKVKAKAATHEPVTLGFDSNARNSTILEKIQQDLKKNLGLKTTLTQADWKTYVKSLKTDPPQIYRFGWLAPFPDAFTHLYAFRTTNPNNATGCGFPEYDQLVDQISRTKPGPAREKLIWKAQAIIVDREAIVIPLLHYAQTHAVSKRVSDFRVNPFGFLHFKELKLAAPGKTN